MAAISWRDVGVPTSPLVAPDGTLRPEWRAFFTSLYLRTGGAQGQETDTANLQAQIDAEEAARAAADVALRAGLDSARAGREIALANYDKAVQVAFREVADALAVRATLDERVAAQQAQTRASEAALRDADALFRNGSVSYLEVLAAQRSLYSSQQSGIALDLTEQDNRIALYKALGGGWKESN